MPILTEQCDANSLAICTVYCSWFLEQLGFTPVTACKARLLSNRPYHLTGFGNISDLFCFSNSTHCHALATILFLRLYFYELSMGKANDKKMYWSCVVYLGVGEEEYRVFNFQEGTRNAWRMQGIKFRFSVNNTSAKSSKVFLGSFFCYFMVIIFGNIN